MKKKIVSLALVLALCLSLLPVTVFAEEEAEVPAEEPIRTHISTVAELQAFATAVNNGDYKNRTDAEVSLDANLDLRGIDWVSIGDNNNYFSGKFYGNGHTISNLDFSSLYGKVQYASDGFFGYIQNATVTDLTIQGTVVTTSAKEYTAFGTIAGETSGATISNCISKVSFKNNGFYVYGMIGLIGYASNTTIKYCRNDGDITITGNMGSLCVGGIAGYIGKTSKINYCSNTGDMTVNAPHAGGIVGHLSGNATMTNCYSIGKLTPIGKGTEDIGGIVGTVGSNTGTNNTVKHCYFGGEIDLTQYTAKLPYTRFGGIVGKRTIAKKDGVDVALVTFGNNFFAAKNNVSACGNDNQAGTAESLDYMKSKEFLSEINTAGGNYQLNPGGTPILPAPKYTVSFDIKPTDLTGVTVKIGEETLDLNTKKIELAAGAYNVTVDGATFSKKIKITADRATHTQQLNLTADYSKVDVALAKVPADLTGYTSSSVAALNEAIAAVGERDKNIAQQADVDAMAQAIEYAITGLVRKSSGSSRPRYDVTTPSKPENGSVTVDPERARSGSRVTVTVTPDSGYKLGELVVTNKDGKKLELTDKGNGQYTFTMPSGKVEVAAEFVKEVEVSPFADVATDAYYYDAVKWAVNKGITNGVSETLFGPDQACTRAQIVTFLWRAAGSPEPKSGSSFADVAADAYYAKAVAWAVENGITKGTSETTFHPDETCTRAQGVTFLYRALGKLAAAQAGFTDVAADSYYADAVNWAAENGVTNGISETLFGPDGSCTRAQIVTFLYRAYQGK